LNESLDLKITYNGLPTSPKPITMTVSCEPNIPVNPRNGRKPRQYNSELYRKMRSAVERFFGWLKSFRRITIRYEKLASTYKALVTIASIIIHLRYGILR
jgi:transposase